MNRNWIEFVSREAGKAGTGYSEQRSEARFRVRPFVAKLRLDNEHPDRTIEVIDVSHRGFGFHADEEIPVGIMVMLVLQRDPQPIAFGETTWSAPHASGFAGGVKIMG